MGNSLDIFSGLICYNLEMEYMFESVGGRKFRVRTTRFLVMKMLLQKFIMFLGLDIVFK